MTFDLNRVLESKRRLRRDLASRPLTEKLSMLDALRERALVLRDARTTVIVKESPGEYDDERSRRNTQGFES